MRVTCARNLKKQCIYMLDIFVKTPLFIYFNFFTIFFPKYNLVNSGCSLCAGADGNLKAVNTFQILLTFFTFNV